MSWNEGPPSRQSEAWRQGWARCHRHRDVSGGWLRPTVFGAVDGLVTNTALIAGVGAGGIAPAAIVLTGLAGLVAGRSRWAPGVRVGDQPERARRRLERDMLARFPGAEQDELADRFRGYGADETATRLAIAVSQDPERALALHTRDELGVHPDELPSPLMAGGASLVAFSIGALLPLLVGLRTLLVPLIVAGIALLAGGMVVGRVTGRSVVNSGLRQLALGALAVIVTFGIGRLIGAAPV